jgi:O-antigen/teichoic acid export membrane protein
MSDTDDSDASGRSSLLNVAIVFAMRVASAGFMFILQVFLARSMTLGDYGSYITMWTWLVMLGAFAALGLAESAVRFVPRYRARARHGSAAAFWRFGLHAMFLAAPTMAIIGILISLWIGDDRVRLIALIVSIGLPFLAMQNFLEGVARAHGWFILTTVQIYVVRPFLIMAACLGLMLTGTSVSLTTTGIVTVAAIALITATLFFSVTHALRKEPTPAPDEDVITGSRRIWLKASLPLMLVSGIDDILIYSDVLILGALLPPEEVSIYFAATRALAIANFVYYAFYFVSARGFSLAAAKDNADRQKLQQVVWATTRATFWFSALAVVLTLVVGPWLLKAFGPKFEAGYSIMVVLGAGIIARGLSGQAIELLVTTGYQRHILAASGAALAVNIVLSLSLIPFLGLMGAAIATALAMALRAILLVIAVRYACGLSVIDLRLPSLRMNFGG